MAHGDDQGTTVTTYYKHLDSGIVHIVRVPVGSHVVTLCIWDETWLAGEPCVESLPPPTCLHCIVQDQVGAS
jgi:hypothetical protein